MAADLEQETNSLGPPVELLFLQKLWDETHPFYAGKRCR